MPKLMDERDALKPPDPAELEAEQKATRELDNARVSDDRIVQRLEEQLRDAHATNASLRERVAEAHRIEKAANYRAAEANAAIAQLEQANAKRKSAEAVATASQRARVKAERELAKAQAELEELRERFDIVKADSDALAALNVRVSAAKHTNDLFGG